ncbi:aspartate kinase [Flavimarina sp. Hel_I_48]|uniref:aspartate kinase n=1 Tax=Flavimarina sp. Hel_I_48 TaxID=1392488 RepID=UPI0004DF52E7|nr:aspartate kinase [Flavimarina sp. Hel_I_48]
MRVFKFGGASVKDVEGLNNVVRVLQQTGADDLVIVVSAMGKTTNTLEEVVAHYFSKTNSFTDILEGCQEYHFDIINALVLDKKQSLIDKISGFFAEIHTFFDTNTQQNYDYVYDQLVSYGELLSSTIVHAVLEQHGFEVEWLDIRKLLRTDANFREAKIDWHRTEKVILQEIKEGRTYITQGFLGSNEAGQTTTLGREGSDYTAAIIASCVNAESVTIWKDVAGVLNADPRYFDKTMLLSHISYNEAIELAFYGASVIHPKTLQPIQKKGIPLYVKPFLDPAAPGTCIADSSNVMRLPPCFILKKNEILIRLSSRDFSFMLEEHLGEVFHLMARYRVKIDLLQNSAISFSLCVEDRFNKIEELKEELKNRFKVEIIMGVELYTIRHFTTEAIADIETNKNVLVKQVAGNMAQLVVK